MDINYLIKKCKEFLKKIEYIDFALIFGSYAQGKPFPFSDLDLAIHTSKDLDLLELGGLITELEELTQKEVDLILLNNLYQENPLLAYHIITEGVLLFSRDEEQWVEYKTKVFLYYFDHKALYEAMNKSFIKRIEENKIGKRNVS